MRTLPLLLVFACGSGVGCGTAQMRQFHVTSTLPDARIDVNGISAGTTPTDIQLKCSKHWVGVMYSPDGWAYDGSVYQVTAFPPTGTGGASETKQVNACMVEGDGPASLHFDTGLELVNPRERIDITVGPTGTANPSATAKGTSYEESIKSLRQLRDAGIITEQEYQQKVLKLAEETGK